MIESQCTNPFLLKNHFETEDFIVYQGFINPDEWDLKFEANQENEICISLSKQEKIFFNSISNELSKYLIDQSEILGDDYSDMLIRPEYVSDYDGLIISAGFDISYLSLLKNVHWPILSQWD